MKKLLALILCLIAVLSFSACSYNPPEGYSKSKHEYEDILKYAKEIDPNATVSENYTDIEQPNRSRREYPAVINGTECHVASVSTLVSNDGIFAGEFPQTYYRIDTDYDYLILQQVIAENQFEWTIPTSSYGNGDSFLILINMDTTEELSDEELDLILHDIDLVHSSYNLFNVRKTLVFGLPSPIPHYENGELVVKDSYSYLQDFSEEGRAEFIARYRKNWSLLSSNLSS